MRLKIDQIFSDILEISEFQRKGATHESFVSIKVKFKSIPVRDFVLDRKRHHGNINLAVLFTFLSDESIVYFNELTPGSVFKLHMEARRRKKAAAWDGSLFVRSGNLFAKDNRTGRIFSLVDEEDLAKIS